MGRDEREGKEWDGKRRRGRGRGEEKRGEKGISYISLPSPICHLFLFSCYTYLLSKTVASSLVRIYRRLHQVCAYTVDTVQHIFRTIILVVVEGLIQKFKINIIERLKGKGEGRGKERKRRALFLL